MRSLTKLALLTSLCLASTAVASANTVATEPAFPRCAGDENTWPNRWSITLNDNNASEKEDFVKALQVIGTGGFVTGGILNFGNSETYIDLSFNTEYFVDAKKAESTLMKGITTLVNLKGVTVSCSAIYRPAFKVGT